MHNWGASISEHNLVGIDESDISEHNLVGIDESDMSNIKCEINRRLVTENNVDIACIDSGEVHDAIKRLNAGKKWLEYWYVLKSYSPC